MNQQFALHSYSPLGSFPQSSMSMQGDTEHVHGYQNTNQDLHNICIPDYCWNEVKINGPAPSTRNCHSSTQFGQYLIIFGGREGEGKKRIVNDIYIFDTEMSRWIPPKTDKHKLPQPRMGHSSQLWNGSYVIIYGGWDGYQVLSDVIFIDLRKGVEKLTFNIPSIIKGEAPMRQFHTANIIDNKMYVFGGGDGKYWLNDLMIFDLQNLEWSGPVSTQGIDPQGRLQHSAVSIDKKIYIFGGEPDQHRQLNDIFYLDTTTLTWVRPIVSGNGPSARVSATGCQIDQKIYYFGGYDGQSWMNDVHVFDIELNRWDKIQTYGYKPRPRCRHTANFVKGQLYIFGGNDSELSFSDVWLLSIGVQVPESSLAADMLHMFESGAFADVTFVLNDVKFKAHKCILASRCNVFANMFSNGMRESQESIITVQDIQPQIFKKVIEFIYSDRLDHLETQEQGIEILVAANKYGIDRLKRLCEKYLVSMIDLENVIELLYLSNMHQASELKRMSINYTMANFDILNKKEDFKRLPKSILLELLQNK